jgi:hypothetical protein
VIFELLAQLARRVERIVLDHDGTEPQDRIERHDVLRTVRKDDRHGVSRDHASIPQSGCGALDRLVQLTI